MWIAGINGYSRFSHRLKFPLTTPDFPPSPSALYGGDDGVWHYVPLLSQAAELTALPRADLLFPRKKRGHWIRCGYRPVSEQPLDKG